MIPAHSHFDSVQAECLRPSRTLLVCEMLLFGTMVLLGTGCGGFALHRVDPPTFDAAEGDPPAEIDPAWFEGRASWYGDRFHGRTTANGETYDMHAFTAAHRNLPFNTVVRVIRQDTFQQVVVRINDRGPFVEGRVIDLSRAAAEDIDMIQRGVVPVRIEVLQWGDGARYF